MMRSSTQVQASPDASKPDARACFIQFFFSGHKPEKKVYSQFGEDGILEAMHRCIGREMGGYYVEFGTQACSECTTRHLREKKGWKGLLMDGGFNNPAINLRREMITSDNIASLFQKYKVPTQFDHLTVDLDLNTFWPAQAVLAAGYRPRTIAVEINRNFNDHLSQSYATINLPLSNTYFNTIKQGQIASCYFGATPRAFTRLFQHFGYLPISIGTEAVNMFFVHKSEVGGLKEPSKPSNVPGDTIDQDFNLESVIAALGEHSSLGHEIHFQCHLNAWVKISPGVNFSSPTWTDELEIVVLSTRHERGFGGNVAGRVFGEEQLNARTKIKLIKTN